METENPRHSQVQREGFLRIEWVSFPAGFIIPSRQHDVPPALIWVWQPENFCVAFLSDAELYKQIAKPMTNVMLGLGHGLPPIYSWGIVDYLTEIVHRTALQHTALQTLASCASLGRQARALLRSQISDNPLACRRIWGRRKTKSLPPSFGYSIVYFTARAFHFTALANSKVSTCSSTPDTGDPFPLLPVTCRHVSCPELHA